MESSHVDFVHNVLVGLSALDYGSIGIVFLAACRILWSGGQSLKMLDQKQLSDGEENTAKSIYKDHLCTIAMNVFLAEWKVSRQTCLNHGEQVQGGCPAVPVSEPLFVHAASDYTKQVYMENYSEKAAETAGLLPTLGFVGTLIGLVDEFYVGSGAQIGPITMKGLGIAVFSSLCALICFGLVEAWRIAQRFKIRDAIAHGIEAAQARANGDDGDTADGVGTNMEQLLPAQHARQ